MRLGRASDQLCVRCGRRASNWHERVSRGRGGPRDSFNAVPICGSGTTGCHGWVTEHSAEAEAEGLYVRGSFVRSTAGCCRVYVGPDLSYREHYNRGDGHATDCPW